MKNHLRISLIGSLATIAYIAPGYIARAGEDCDYQEGECVAIACGLNGPAPGGAACQGNINDRISPDRWKLVPRVFRLTARDFPASAWPGGIRPLCTNPTTGVTYFTTLCGDVQGEFAVGAGCNTTCGSGGGVMSDPKC